MPLTFSDNKGSLSSRLLFQLQVPRKFPWSGSWIFRISLNPEWCRPCFPFYLKWSFIMDFPISALSEQTFRKLDGSSGGRIHSVYRNTVNLAVGGRLFSIQARETVLSPISLITDLDTKSLSRLPLQKGESVLISGHQIRIKTLSGEIRLSCRPETAHYDADLASHVREPLSESFLHALREEAAAALSLSGSSGFAPLFSEPSRETTDSPFLAAAGRILRETLSCCRTGSWNQAAVSLCRLLGLGPGLTPSGDDFLCGFFAGLILSGKNEHPLSLGLKTAVQQHMADTNDISAAFLQSSLNGEFSLPVIELVSLPDKNKIYSNFNKIGHSSGFDTLCGIDFALRLAESFL